MNTQKNTPLKNAMTYGLILGLALIIMHLVQYILDVYKPPFWVSLLNYVLIIGVLVYGTIRYRDDELEGYIPYGKAVGFGVLISLFASIVYGFYFFLLTTIFDPTYIDGVYVMLEELYLEQGMSEDQVEMAIEMAKKFQNPTMLMISSVLGFVLMGTLFSLISSIFLKKEKPLFENAETEE